MGVLKKITLGILTNAIALYGLVFIVDKIEYGGGVLFFIVGGLFLGLLNQVVKPLIKIFSLPLVFLTGGLFLIVINGIILWFLEYVLQVVAFREVYIVIPDLSSYIIGGIIIGILNWILHLFIKNQ